MRSLECNANYPFIWAHCLSHYVARLNIWWSRHVLAERPLCQALIKAQHTSFNLGKNKPTLHETNKSSHAQPFQWQALGYANNSNIWLCNDVLAEEGGWSTWTELKLILLWIWGQISEQVNMWIRSCWQDSAILFLGTQNFPNTHDTRGECGEETADWENLVT